METAIAKIEFEIKRTKEMAYACGDAWGAQGERAKYDWMVTGLEKALEIVKAENVFIV